SGDKSFASQLACAISRDRNAGAVVFGEGNRGVLAIYTAPGRVENLLDAGNSYGFENVLSKISALPEIDVGLGTGLCNVRICGEMKDRVTTGHRGSNGVEFFQVVPNYLHSRIGRTLLKVT